MKIGYDRIVLLDYRQNLTAKALADKGRTTSPKKITQFKQADMAFVQLTDEVLVEKNHPELTPMTALSKLVIRGHCCAGSRKITSDEYEHEHTRLQPEMTRLNTELTAKNMTLDGLRLKIDAKKQELKALATEHRSLWAEAELKIEAYVQKYPCDPGVKRTYSRDLELRTLLERIDELANQHALVNAAINPLITPYNQGIQDAETIRNSLANAQKELKKQTISVKRLAEFIRDNTSPANIVPKRYATTGGVGKSLTRRLTIQAAMCEGGATALRPDGAVEPSFLESLHRALMDFGVKANVVGYITSTAFTRGLTHATREHYDPANPFALPMTRRIPGEYKSVGFGQAKTLAKPDPADPSRTVDVPTKMMFNEDHPEGIDYAIWKGSALGAADGPMADFMLELQQEIWDAAWQTRGKGFMGRQIVPDGIVQLRRLLPQGWNPDTQTVTSMEGLWREVRAVMRTRLGTNVGNRRHDLTTAFYEKYHTVMSCYYN